jgi:serine/threonine protein kinase
MARESAVGRVVGGRYRLVARLASGGFGYVWKAHDLALDVGVAVKEMRLPPGLPGAEHSERVARAVREARHAATLRDRPNIVAVHDVVTERGVPFMVMRLVTGESLAQRLAAGRPLPPAEAETVARGLLTALEAAHEAGIAHRDVKPSNVLIDASGEVLLTDFGIAVHETDETLTAEGLLVGTPGFVPPERVRGAGGDPSAGDLFALGATLYQATEGVPPFGATPRSVLDDEPPAPRRAGHLEPLITLLLQKDPGRRPTAAQSLAMLETLTVTRPVPRNAAGTQAVTALLARTRTGAGRAGRLAAR